MPFRSGPTLSGGESQRIRLAAQVGSGLRSILYVLNEPSIGLHARDQSRLLTTLRALRDRGNTVCVVEHDEDTMMSSDHLVDVGPARGGIEQMSTTDESPVHPMIARRWRARRAPIARSRGPRWSAARSRGS